MNLIDDNIILTAASKKSRSSNLSTETLMDRKSDDEKKKPCCVCHEFGCDTHPRSCIDYIYESEPFAVEEEKLQWLALWWFIREAENNIDHPLAKGLTEVATRILSDTTLMRLQCGGEQEFIPGVGVRLKFEHLVEILEFNGANFTTGISDTYHTRIDDKIMRWVDESRRRGLTVLGVWYDNSLQSIISLADRKRPQVKEFISAVFNRGIDFRMSTGDNTNTAMAFANQLGIPTTHVFAQVDSVEKARVVSHLSIYNKGRTVMLGDGVNDVKALNEADIGISFGSTTANLLVTAADVIFLGVNMLNIMGFLFVMEAAQRTVARNRILSSGCGILGGVIAAGVLYTYDILPGPVTSMMIVQGCIMVSTIYGSFLFLQARLIKRYSIRSSGKSAKYRRFSQL